MLNNFWWHSYLLPSNIRHTPWKLNKPLPTHMDRWSEINIAVTPHSARFRKLSNYNVCWLVCLFSAGLGRRASGHGGRVRLADRRQRPVELTRGAPRPSDDRRAVGQRTHQGRTLVLHYARVSGIAGRDRWVHFIFRSVADGHRGIVLKRFGYEFYCYVWNEILRIEKSAWPPMDRVARSRRCAL